MGDMSCAKCPRTARIADMRSADFEFATSHVCTSDPPTIRLSSAQSGSARQRRLRAHPSGCSGTKLEAVSGSRS
eukprot:7417245-Alexandrium_andersonii.AAC.1